MVFTYLRTKTLIRNLFIILIILSVDLYATDSSLKVYSEIRRFKNDNGTTRFEINYKIFYDQLNFKDVGESFQANIETNIKILSGNNILKDMTFETPVIEYEPGVILSGTYYYLDRIVISLPQTYNLELQLTDKGSGKSYLLQKELQPIDSMISEIEFSELVIDADSTKNRFYRQHKLFYVNPSHIFNKADVDSIYLYFEYDKNLKAQIATLDIYNNSDSVKYKNYTIEIRSGYGYLAFPISAYNANYYNTKISILNEQDVVIAEASDYFVIKEETGKGIRLFPDLEDEYVLMKCFINDNKLKSWKELSEFSKQSFITKFWNSVDPNPVTPENELLATIQERIKYCNDNFSHSVSGWKSDRGRIYLRNGVADEIRNYSTTAISNYPDKDYTVWKYNSNGKIYLFFDLRGDGSYKLIFSENDDKETTQSNWKTYVGSDFDEAVLD